MNKKSTAVLVLTIFCCACNLTVPDDRLALIAPDGRRQEAKEPASVQRGNSKQFVRMRYYRKGQPKEVNSYPSLPVNTCGYSVKLICFGNGRKQIKLYDKKASLIQTLMLKNTDAETNPYASVSFIDMNFDYYPDLKVNYGCGGSGNCIDEFWLYEPEKRQFQYHEKLSTLVSATAYPREKRIESYYRSGIHLQVLEDYAFRNNKLILMREEAVNSDTEFTHRVYERVGDSMKLVVADNLEYDIRN